MHAPEIQSTFVGSVGCLLFGGWVLSRRFSWAVSFGKDLADSCMLPSVLRSCGAQMLTWGFLMRYSMSFLIVSRWRITSGFIMRMYVPCACFMARLLAWP